MVPGIPTTASRNPAQRIDLRTPALQLMRLVNKEALLEIAPVGPHHFKHNR